MPHDVGPAPQAYLGLSAPGESVGATWAPAIAGLALVGDPLVLLLLPSDTRRVGGLRVDRGVVILAEAVTVGDSTVGAREAEPVGCRAHVPGFAGDAGSATARPTWYCSYRQIPLIC